MEIEKPPWYERILADIKERDQKCRIQGIGHVTTIKKHPFSNRTYEEFLVNNPYKNKEKKLPYCKYHPERNFISKSTDKRKRYYKDNIKNEKECSKVKGSWDPHSINRDNKYGRGVCWTNELQEQCASLTDEKLIIPDLKKKNMHLAQDNKQKCETNLSCTWDDQLLDCHAKMQEKKVDTLVASYPPPNMPTDFSTEDAQIQNYLYKWYMLSTPNEPPKTDELFGTGNRCSNKPSLSTSESEFVPGTLVEKHMYTKDELKSFKITLLHKKDKYLIYAIGQPNYEILGKLQFQLMAVLDNLKKHPSNEEFKKEKEIIENDISVFWDKIDNSDLYQGIDDIEDYDNYYTFGNKKVDETQIEKEKEYLPSLSQSIVNMLMKKIAIDREASSNRGIICWHSTGSGKTCTASGVMDAFWNTDRQIIFASSKDAIASNPPTNFHLCVSRLYPRFKDQPLPLIADAFEKRNIRFFSFAELANRIEKMEKIKKELNVFIKPRKQKVGGTAGKTKMDELVIYISGRYGVSKERAKDAAYKARANSINDIVDLDYAVLIVDEVHNLFRPISNQKKLYGKVEERITNPVVHPNLKVIILTATPGDNVTDSMKLINSVRDPTHPIIKAPNPENAEDVSRFKHDLRGLVSYFDMSGDATKFPKVYDNGPVKYPMSAKQFATYVEKYKEVSEGMKNYDKLAKNNQLSKFWQGARKYSNMLYNMEKSMKLTEFSSKLPALLEKIQAFPKEKQYCYSAFYTNQGSGHGILEIGRQLEALGYSKLTVKEAKEVNKGGKVLQPKKRYILAIQKEIGEEGSSSAGNNLHEMLRIYNSEANKNGEIVHMLLASQGFNEGLDLKDVRHIHIFEPLVTMASDLQTIGRARRFCSHAHLDQKDWTVQIHRYLTDFPGDNSKDKQEMEIHITNVQGIISSLEQKISDLRRGDTNKKALQEKLKSAKSELKLLNKNAKKQIDHTNIKNIDEYIYSEAQNRMKELFTIYHCMKESAVDCQILKRFHGNSAIHCIDENSS